MEKKSVFEISENAGSFSFSKKTIDDYLTYKQEQGVAAVALAKYKIPLMKLLEWIGEDDVLTAQRLKEWRKTIESCGYSKSTEQNYVRIVNDFLRTVGHREMCIPKPLQKDLTGQQFGYLTVIAQTEKRRRKDIVWKCACKCGREAEIPTVQLLNGNTISCGCLKVEILGHTNRYVDGTSLRQSMEERVTNPNSVSGYVGVQPKRDKWSAFITYKRKRYNLGTFYTLEEAVKARAIAKAQIMEEARKLYEETEYLYSEKPRVQELREKIKSH